MAVHTTFFLCEPRELQVGFPGWKLPLTQPVTRTGVNPFTREEVTVETREPEWDNVYPDNLEMPEREVIAIEGDYDTYLQNRIPPFVQRKPHWCAKSLTSVELEPLVAVACDVDEQELEFALYAHPSLSAALQQFPDDFVARLKSADETILNAVSQKWAAEMSTPDFTHSVNGERLEDDWTLDDAMSVLRPIAELARAQENDQSMYLLTEV